MWKSKSAAIDKLYDKFLMLHMFIYSLEYVPVATVTQIVDCADEVARMKQQHISRVLKLDIYIDTT
jgi:hypothetical protein